MKKARILSLLLALVMCLTLLPTAALAEEINAKLEIPSGITINVKGADLSGVTEGGGSTSSTQGGPYTVTFISEGMADIVLQTTEKDGKQYIETPEPVRPGYNIFLWHSMTGGGLLEPNKRIEITEDTTFEAIWRQIIYSITVPFKANGGKFSDGSDTKNYTIPLSSDGREIYQLSQRPEEPTRDGYIFDGWEILSDGADLSGIMVIGGSGTIPSNIKPDIMDRNFEEGEWAEAKWKEDPSAPGAVESTGHSVTFSASGGKFADGSASKSYQTKANLDGTFTLTQKPESPTRSGYTFSGWKVSDLQRVVIITDTVTSGGDRNQVGASDTPAGGTSDIMSFDFKDISDMEAVWVKTESAGEVTGTITTVTADGTTSTGSTSPAATQPKFTDVAATSPFAPAISWAVEKGITNGTTSTTFSPGTTCTTGHILTFLWRSQGSPEPTIQNPFKDEIPNSFQKAAIWAYEKGLVSGSTFGSANPCTRAASVTYMWKLAGSPTAKASSFKDVQSGSDYAKAINWAVEKGVTNGTGDGTTFSPDNTTTRGQIVTFLYRGQAK